MQRICTYILIFCMIALLSSCAYNISLNEANRLFDEQRYEEALVKYKNIANEGAKEDIYNRAVILYKEKRFATAMSYFEIIPDYKDASKYRHISEILSNLRQSEKEHLKYTSILAEYKKSGFEEAEQLLEQEPFKNYTSLIDRTGVYRSKKSFKKSMHENPYINSMLGGGYELYTYIYMGDEIKSAAYMPESQLVGGKITEEKLVERADSNSYRCDCIYEKNGRYKCDAYYKDSITKESASYSFYMYLQGEELVIESLNSTEKETQKSFTEGTYIKLSY